MQSVQAVEPTQPPQQQHFHPQQQSYQKQHYYYQHQRVPTNGSSNSVKRPSTPSSPTLPKNVYHHHHRTSSAGLDSSYHNHSGSQSSFTLPVPRTRMSSRPMSSRSSVSSLDFGPEAYGNGYGNGYANGYANGYTNGGPPPPPPPQHQQQHQHQHQHHQSLPPPGSAPAPAPAAPSNYNGHHSRRPSTSSPSINELASQFASASMFDLSQSYITPHMGNNTSNLMPRIKTIELYRKNAKKSNDPVIQFQFAQYMLQTALLSGTSSFPRSSPASSASSTNSGSNQNNYNTANGMLSASPNQIPRPSSSASLPMDKKSSKHISTLSTGSGTILTSDQENKIKSDLLKEAISNLRKLSDKGYADAQYLLGDAYASGALGKPDLKESYTLFQLAAKHGHGEASYRAALCLEEGWGTSKDVRRAVQFLRNAASKNQPGAMLRLGLACFYGRLGMPSTITVKQEGIKWLTRSAEAANEIFPQAPYELAKIYEVGYKDIVFKDHSYAVQLYVKSAELNYVPAAAKLGHAYEYGQLQCPQDAALSIHYYTIAALGGDPGSMLAMCAWYMVGADPVLPRNEEEAYEWAHRAAECGLAKAQFAVGYFLENGVGAERDILQSANWYRKAAAGGDERAVERLKKNRDMSGSGGVKSKRDDKNKDKDCIVM